MLVHIVLVDNVQMNNVIFVTVSTLLASSVDLNCDDNQQEIIREQMHVNPDADPEKDVNVPKALNELDKVQVDKDSKNSK